MGQAAIALMSVGFIYGRRLKCLLEWWLQYLNAGLKLLMPLSFFGWFAGFVEETVEISIFRSTVRVKHVRAVMLTWQ